MISLEKCEAYLNECQALGAEAKLTLRRATAAFNIDKREVYEWASAMPGSRLVTRFANTKLSLTSPRYREVTIYRGFPRTTIGSFAKRWIPATILISQLLA